MLFHIILPQIQVSYLRLDNVVAGLGDIRVVDLLLRELLGPGGGLPHVAQRAALRQHIVWVEHGEGRFVVVVGQA